MSAQHTPGPWYPTVTEDGAVWVETDNLAAKGIAVVTAYCGYDARVPNARLIAAAPEMLELLNECFDFLGGVDDAVELRDKLLATFVKIGGEA